MRDYAELISDLRRHHCDAKEDDTQEVCEECAYDVIVSDNSKFSGITDVCTCGLMHRAADAIEELLDELTTIRKQLPHWISVEDELPESGERVLIMFEPFEDDENISIGWLTKSGFDCYDDSVYFFRSVTHWMPLPAPPKVK